MEGSRTPIPRAKKSEDEEKEEGKKWVNMDKGNEVMISREWMKGKKQSGGNGEKGGTQKNKKRMVSRSKSRKTIGPCSSSAQASTFRRFPMSPLEQREGTSLWVMGGG